MAGVQVGQDLFLKEATCIGEIALTRAIVGGTLFADGTTFAAAMKMGGLQVSKSLSLKKGTCNGHVSLSDAKVGEHLVATGRASRLPWT